MGTEIQEFKPKSFWQRPEGVTGMLFMGGIILGGGYLLYRILPTLISLTENILYLSGLLIALAVVIYMVLDPRMRNLVWYFYKSVMRWFTGLFVQIDPIGILKSYVEDLESNLTKMNKQIGILKGQMHKLKEMITNNQKEIQNNLSMANRAKDQDQQGMMVLKARRAGRLQDSNMKLDDLYKKMEILYKVLGKMYDNSAILKEDIADQIVVKEQEYNVIRTSHSAMRSAMNIINGNSDKKAMYDMAMDHITEDVSQKVGEMERFMDVSSNFMNSIDLQNGVFEEEGMALLDKWEKEGTSLLLGKDKELLLSGNAAMPTTNTNTGTANKYDSLFD